MTAWSALRVRFTSDAQYACGSHLGRGILHGLQRVDGPTKQLLLAHVRNSCDARLLSEHVCQAANASAVEINSFKRHP